MASLSTLDKYDDKDLKRFVRRAIKLGRLTLAHYECIRYSGPAVIMETRENSLASELGYALKWARVGKEWAAYPDPKFKRRGADERHVNSSAAE